MLPVVGKEGNFPLSAQFVHLELCKDPCVLSEIVLPIYSSSP